MPQPCTVQIPLEKPVMLFCLLIFTFAAAPKGELVQRQLLEATGELKGGALCDIKMVASGPTQRKVSGSLPLTCTITGAPLDSRLYDWNYVRQTARGELQFLGWIYPFGNNTGYAPPFQGRVTITADKAEKKVSLQLQALTAADTATYFCSRQHTLELGVTTDKLVFGSGVTISVEPKSQEQSALEVIALTSRKSSQESSKVNVACLARNFYSKNINLDAPKGDTVYDLKEPLVTSEGSYNLMKIVVVEPDTELTCKALHEGNKTAASTALPDAKMEKGNTLLMTVLGLRVLLTKSIAFNVLMTLRLWLF
ncbi:LOW QUALITY PROTEIN: immunoglobulin delta heavy chain-like [Eudromia elegans]